MVTGKTPKMVGIVTTVLDIMRKSLGSGPKSSSPEETLLCQKTRSLEDLRKDSRELKAEVAQLSLTVMTLQSLLEARTVQCKEQERLMQAMHTDYVRTIRAESTDMLGAQKSENTFGDKQWEPN